MGKRKSSRAPPKKVKITMEREFNCLFCNHEKCIEVKLDRKLRRGTLRCAVCNEEWSQAIGVLTDATDVYHAWIDAIELANKDVKYEAEGSDHGEDEGGEEVQRKAAPKPEEDSDDEDLPPPPLANRRPEQTRDDDSDDDLEGGKKETRRKESDNEDEDEDSEDAGPSSSRKLKRPKLDLDSDDEDE